LRYILILTITIINLIAGGYKIPEQSLNSMALSGANVAYSISADTAYFNPANMSFMKNSNFIESGITLAHLPSNKFSGFQALSPINILPSNNSSEVENIYIPFFHFVSKEYNNFRYGLSLTVPDGLTKRWDNGLQKLFAQKFKLKIIEINPSFSYKVNNKFSIGGGIRFIYSEGIVKSDGFEIGKPIKRDMEGDTVEFGYNLALSYRPLDTINIALTYRSNIDLKEEGKAKLSLNNLSSIYDTSVTIPLPASLNLAISKKLSKDFIVEFNYEKTFWSKYKNLDFNYKTPIFSMLKTPFDDPKAKNWKDTNTYRVGVSWQVTDNITLMGAYAYDETPVPIKNLSYELPDSNAHIFSAGIRIKHNKKLSYGFAILYDKKDDISIKVGENANGIIGEFNDGGAILTTFGISYEF
jgi:long-chain fatty acid transport protein